MLVLDGVYLTGSDPRLFRPVEPPGAAELEQVLERIASRIGERLERLGLITRDCENTYLALDPAESGPLHDPIGHSITYRLATGPRQGQKLFTLQTLPARDERQEEDHLARAHRFSLHAGVVVTGTERTRLDAGMDARGRATQEQLPSISCATSRAPPLRPSGSRSRRAASSATR